MEFLAVVGVVILSGLGAAVLTVNGNEDSAVASAMLDVVKVGFGAVVALAYTAKDGKKQP